MSSIAAMFSSDASAPPSSYAVGWVLGPEKQSLLEISNAESSRSKRIHAIVWSQTGVIIGDHYLTVPPLQTVSVDVSKFLDDGASASAAGTVELRNADSPSAIRAWLRMTDATLNKTWSVPVTAGYIDEELPILHAAWPRSAGPSEIHLHLYNSGNAAVVCSESSVGEPAANRINLTVGPHQTIDTVLPETASNSPIKQSTLTYSAPVGSIHAFLLEEEEAGKTKRYISFGAAHTGMTADEVTWVFPPAMEPGPSSGALSSGLRSQKLLLVNWSIKSVPISVRTLFGAQSANPLPVAALDPGEARMVDVPLNATASARNYLTSGLVVGTQGKVGNVTVSYVYADDNLGIRDWFSGSVIKDKSIDEITWGGPGSTVSLDGLLADQSSQNLNLALLYQSEDGVSLYKRSYSEPHSQAGSRLSLAELSLSRVPDDNMQVLPTTGISGIAVATTAQTLLSVEPTNGPECLANCTAQPTMGQGFVDLNQTLAHATPVLVAGVACEGGGGTSCPSTLTLGTPVAFALATTNGGADVPTPWRTGIGISQPVIAGPSSTNFANQVITESVTTNKKLTTCSLAIFPNEDPCPANGGSGHSFTIGVGGPVNFPAGNGIVNVGSEPVATNTFYDLHGAVSPDNALSSGSCVISCSQTYFCGGSPLANFTITKTLMSGTVNGVSVTNVGVTVK